MKQTLGYFAEIEPWVPAIAFASAPMSHGSGCYGLPFVAMGAKTIVPERARFDPDEIAALLPVHGNVSFFAAPTMVSRSSIIPDSPPRIIAVCDHHYGGAPMHSKPCRARMDFLGPKFAQIYGQGEVPMTITALTKGMHADPRGRAGARSWARTTSRTNVEVRVADGEDRRLPAGEIGEVLVRGEVVMKGYWKNSQATAERLRGGWLHTGDMGAFDEEGFLTLKDRSKDLIISGGSNVYPREVEECCCAIPACSRFR